jgi:hypothetical protein
MTPGVESMDFLVPDGSTGACLYPERLQGRAGVN